MNNTYNEMDDELRPEYDLSKLKGGIKRKYTSKYKEGTNVILLAPDVADIFKDNESGAFPFSWLEIQPFDLSRYFIWAQWDADLMKSMGYIMGRENRNAPNESVNEALRLLIKIAGETYSKTVQPNA